MKLNTQKWAGILILGAFTGALDCSFDTGAKIGDYIRHALLGMMPAAVGLKITLERELGVEEPPKTRGASAG